ncbi:MAG: hypothetical protein EA344_08990 [Alkalicoccus sp.]|nr:MAG: hypothetical protein EA344_08990 [Alkalicoccus sp.]
MSPAAPGKNTKAFLTAVIFSLTRVHKKRTPLRGSGRSYQKGEAQPGGLIGLHPVYTINITLQLLRKINVHIKKV